MKSVICPYCGEKSFTSNPQVMSKCAMCREWFAEAQNDAGQTLVVINSNMPGAADLAAELSAKWQEAGENRVAIVDRRRLKGRFGGTERRLSPLRQA